MTPRTLAQLYQDTAAKHAARFGFPSTSWGDLEHADRELMVATAADVLGAVCDPLTTDVHEHLLRRLRGAAEGGAPTMSDLLATTTLLQSAIEDDGDDPTARRMCLLDLAALALRGVAAIDVEDGLGEPSPLARLTEAVEAGRWGRVQAGPRLVPDAPAPGPGKPTTDPRASDAPAAVRWVAISATWWELQIDAEPVANITTTASGFAARLLGPWGLGTTRHARPCGDVGAAMGQVAWWGEDRGVKVPPLPVDEVEPTPAASRWESWGADKHRLFVSDVVVATLTKDGGLHRVEGCGPWAGKAGAPSSLADAVARVIEIGVEMRVEVPPFYEAEGAEWSLAAVAEDGALSLFLEVGGAHAATAWRNEDAEGVGWTDPAWGRPTDVKEIDPWHAVGIIIARAASQGIGVPWPVEWPAKVEPTPLRGCSECDGPANEDGLCLDADCEGYHHPEPDDCASGPWPTPTADYQALDAQLMAGREAGHSDADDDTLLDSMDAAHDRLSIADVEAVNEARRAEPDALPWLDTPDMGAVEDLEAWLHLEYEYEVHRSGFDRINIGGAIELTLYGTADLGQEDEAWRWTASAKGEWVQTYPVAVPVEPDKPLLREAHDAGYRCGYLNAIEDERTGDESFGPDPGDSFDLWLDEQLRAEDVDPDKAVAKVLRAAEAALAKTAPEWRKTGDTWRLWVDGEPVVRIEGSRLGWHAEGIRGWGNYGTGTLGSPEECVEHVKLWGEARKVVVPPLPVAGE